MKPIRFALAALALLGAAPAVHTHSAHAQSGDPRSGLELKRVLLSTGGVGYFEFEAAVDGNARLSLPVRLDQVDDVLKSIVVFDDKGGVGGIALPGRAPLDEAFRDLPFSQNDLRSPQALLNALVGAEVTVGGPRQAAGRILKVIPETVRLPNDAGTLTRHRVTLMSAQGMKQFVLEEAESVTFADRAIQAQVDAALAAVARHRVQDRRTLTIEATGKGRRTVRVGYVAGAPLWKASYRLSVPENAGKDAKGLLQGWAIVENLSGQDWKNVELTLVSGNPVTFRQQLYTAYFVKRPEVPVEVMGRVLPPPDQGTVGTAEARAKAEAPAQGFQRRAMPAPAPAPMAAMRDVAPGMAAGGAMGGAARPAPLAPAGIAAAETQEATTQVLFTAPAPVSVAAGETLALPIVSRSVPVQRLALYQPRVDAAHPLAAVELANDTGASLPPGVLTLYERGKGGANYVGDARLAPLPAGDKRLLSFAVDQKIAADRESKSREAVLQAKIARGALTLSYRDEQTTVYRFKSAAGEDRALLVEHPRLAGWELAQPKPAEAELTRGDYRIRRGLAKGAALVVEVTLTRTRFSTVQLAGQSRQTLLAYARTGGIDAKARAALEKLAALQGEVDRFDRLAKEAAAERDGIARDQDRLRQNLGSVPPGSDLAKRYLDTMKKQEDRVDALRAAEDDARAKLKAARDALADAIQKTEV